VAAERLDMRSVREVLRLHFVCGKSPRKIAQSLGCGRATIRDYLARANKNGLVNGEAIEKLSDVEVEARLGFARGTKQFWRNETKAMPDWALVYGELARNKSVTLALLWQEHLNQDPGGYQYTQYCEHYRRWSKKLSVVMRQNHKAGEKAFVDYCDGLSVVDPATGELRSTELFVGALGASSYTYAEATFTQTLPDWLSSHVRMYEFFGGVPEITVPDNLKSGVTKPCFYEPILNESYRDLAAHYKTAIIPAHVRKPKHKAKVEVAVLVAQRWILACLRHHIFHSLEELNAAIRPLLEKLNKRRMRHLHKSRLELFQELDRPALQALPLMAYEFAEWLKAKVNINYHIECDKHFYSVHYTHVHETVQVRLASNVIEIYLKGERIASHRRSYVRGKYTTLTEHMPKAHQARGKWPPSRFIEWAGSLAPSAGLLVEKILSSRVHPEQAYTSALGITRLGKNHGGERLEKCCARALELGAHSYRFVADMLKNDMDKLLPDQSKQVPLKRGLEEANSRGKKYYH
jgi:transposase